MRDSSAGIFFFETDGFSMWPFFKGREKLIVKKSMWEELARGDLIVYRQADQVLICHRLIKKSSSSEQRVLYCRGDASAADCDRVSFDNCLGRVVGHVKGNSYVWHSGFRARLANRLALVLMPICARLVDRIMRYRRKK